MIISIASGKGGTGKTTFAVNLALSLSTATLVDCDVEEPNANLFLRAKIEETEDVCVPVPKIDLSKCMFCNKCAKLCQYNALAVIKNTAMVFKELCHGCGLCAAACPVGAITEAERKIGVVEEGHKKNIRFLQGVLNVGEARSTPVIKKLREKAGMEGTVILDCPPGTGCPVVESIGGSDYCVLVTEPTLFGLHDLNMAVELCRVLNVPCGVVVNRDGVGGADVEGYCRKKGIPILMRIPFERKIAELYSKGAPFVKEMPEWKEKFRKLFEGITEKTVDKERIMRRRQILDAADIVGGTLLDVGAGPLGLVAAKEYGCVVTAIDNCAEKIKEVQKKADEYGASICLEHGDASKMPYTDSSFDYVICLGTLHHVPQALRKKVISECLRTAKKKAVIVEYTKEGFEKIHPDGKYKRVDLKMVERELSLGGAYTKEDCTDYNIYISSKET